jgi:hypothetical protein
MKMKKRIRLWVIVIIGIFFCDYRIFAMESGDNSGAASDFSDAVGAFDEVRQPDEKVPCHMQCVLCGEPCDEAVQALYTFKNKTYVVVFHPGCLAEKINELRKVFDCPQCRKNCNKHVLNI